MAATLTGTGTCVVRTPRPPPPPPPPLLPRPWSWWCPRGRRRGRVCGPSPVPCRLEGWGVRAVRAVRAVLSVRAVRAVRCRVRAHACVRMWWVHSFTLARVRAFAATVRGWWSKGWFGLCARLHRRPGWRLIDVGVQGRVQVPVRQLLLPPQGPPPHPPAPVPVLVLARVRSRPGRRHRLVRAPAPHRCTVLTTPTPVTRSTPATATAAARRTSS